MQDQMRHRPARVLDEGDLRVQVGEKERRLRFGQEL